ncbi:hypothetical protein HK100_008343 [Physocladia obscura]|uniref:Uncharacterized protein n=1 Tax=Physocladia obscura TaxID=109957 RepID=A0AAD5SQT3_9FUNG|nr:hypothetical protein HK100_008343 [Physocladia obscura]
MEAMVQFKDEDSNFALNLSEAHQQASNHTSNVSSEATESVTVFITANQNGKSPVNESLEGNEQAGGLEPNPGEDEQCPETNEQA